VSGRERILRLRAELAQARDEADEICRVLKEANGGDSRGAGGETSGGVFQSDPAYSEDGNSHVAANFCEKFQPLRRAEGCFGRGSENGAEEEIIRAGSGGGLRRFERVAGDAREKVVPYVAAGRSSGYQTLGFSNRQGIFTEVNAAGALGDGHIETVVYHDAGCQCAGRPTRWRSCLRNAAQSFARERGAVFPRQVFFANLNPIQARGSRCLYFFEQRFDGIFARSNAQAMAVCYIAEDGRSIRHR
jgi:hypothetical protein